MKFSLVIATATIGCASAARDLAGSMSMSTDASPATYDGAVLDGVEPDHSSDDPFDGMTSEDGKLETYDGAVLDGVEPDHSSDDPFDGMTSEDVASDDPYDGVTSEDAGAAVEAKASSPAANVVLSGAAAAAAVAGVVAFF